jgi:hypothetical protein
MESDPIIIEAKTACLADRPPSYASATLSATARPCQKEHWLQRRGAVARRT